MKISPKLEGHHHFAFFKSSVFLSFPFLISFPPFSFLLSLFSSFLLVFLSHFSSPHSLHCFFFFQCCATYVVTFFFLTLLLSRLHCKYCCIFFSSCVASNLATNILCFFMVVLLLIMHWNYNKKISLTILQLLQKKNQLCYFWSFCFCLFFFFF